MLKSVKYNDISYKFHSGINRINNERIIDIAITSFGGFTDSFPEGVGRRVDLLEGECELSVNTVAKINNKTFHFSRCYTNDQLDTKELDKKQDIVKYANKLEENIDDEKNILPIISYYSKSINFEDYNFPYYNRSTDVRSYGYSNCLIVKNKFNPTQDFFKFISFFAYQNYVINNMNNVLVNNYYIAMNNISSALQKIGYNGIIFDNQNEQLLVSTKNNFVPLRKLNEKHRIYIAIIFDLNMRCLMLNPKQKNCFNNEGCIAITYNFNDEKIMSKLICSISKQFHKLQILI